MPHDDKEVAECLKCDALWVGEGSFAAALEHMKTTGHSTTSKGFSI